MQTITYFSSAKTLFSKDELLALLEKSRDANLKFGITGMLLYKSGSFIQAIEGEKEPLHRLYQNICNDPTHHQIITAIDAPAGARAFPDWSMGFRDISAADIPDGYTDFLKTPSGAEAFMGSPSRAKKLLAYFYASTRSTLD